MLTLGQVQNSSVANVAGVNVTDPQFAQLVNDAIQQLIDIGNWFGTVRAMIGSSVNGCVVWPDGVEAVLALTGCHRKIEVRDYWYEFVPIRDGLAGAMRTAPGMHPESVVGFTGTTPVFIQPSTFNPFQVQATADAPIDYGKTITIYGKDTNGQEIVSLRSDGSTQRGVQLTLAAANTFTTQVFTEIYAVTKDITVGNVRLWWYAPSHIFATVIGIYAGAQTSPSYLFSKMGGPCTPSVEALVKFAFRPASQPSDLLSIDCLDAIKCQVQAIKSRDAGDPEKSIMYEKMAIRRLNMQMRARFPKEQFVFAFRPFGNDTLERQKIGYLI